jgi:hypothetical protein
MSVRVMTQVWALDLPDSEKLVLLALADCANDEGGCWPSMKTLADKCSKSDRTVQAAIQSLVSKGHLTREENPGKGCHYYVHPRFPKADAPTPEAASPRKDFAPKQVRATPEAASPDPRSGFGQTVKNHQEPSEVKSADADDFTFSDFVESWNEAAARHGLPRIVRPGDRLKRAFRARNREYPEIEHWRNAFRCLERTDWLHGKNDRGWRADSDFFLQPKSFTKLVEGSYGQTH